MIGCTIYSEKTAVEILGKEKIYDGKKESVVTFRFFTSDSTVSDLKYDFSPMEAYEVYKKIIEIAEKGGTLAVMPIDENNIVDEKKVLTIRRRENREDYLMAIRRGESSIKVAMNKAEFIYAGELIRSLSFSQTCSNQ